MTAADNRCHSQSIAIADVLRRDATRASPSGISTSRLAPLKAHGPPVPIFRLTEQLTKRTSRISVTSPRDTATRRQISSESVTWPRRKSTSRGRSPSRGSSALADGLAPSVRPHSFHPADSITPIAAVSHFDPPDKGNAITTIASHDAGSDDLRTGRGEGERRWRGERSDFRSRRGIEDGKTAARGGKKTLGSGRDVQDGDSQGRRGQKWRSYVYSRTGRTHQLLEIKLGMIGFLLLSLLLNDRLELILILLSS